MTKYVANSSPEEMPDLSANPVDREEIIFMDKSMGIAHHIYELMKDLGLKQKDLAERMGKSEAELSKWLNGRHNFTIRSLAKLEAALGLAVIETPKDAFYHVPVTLCKTMEFDPKEETEYEFSGRVQPAKVIEMAGYQGCERQTAFL